MIVFCLFIMLASQEYTVAVPSYSKPLWYKGSKKLQKKEIIAQNRRTNRTSGWSVGKLTLEVHYGSKNKGVRERGISVIVEHFMSL